MRNTPSRTKQVTVLDPTPRRDYSLERGLLAERGIPFLVPDGRRATAEELRATAVLLVHLGPVTQEIVADLTACRGIVVYGTGIDAADTEAVRASRIPRTSVPGFCTDEVSDHAMALMLAADRRVVELATATRAGRWAEVKGTLKFRRLRGRTLGVVGAGRIGRLIATKARAFGLRTIAADPYPAGPPDDDLPIVALPELLGDSDIVVLSVPLTPDTHHLMTATTFTLMRPGSLLVNVSRGAVVDEAALADALDAGRPGFAALDVREVEPPLSPDALAARSDVIVTPHVAASSVEAARTLSTSVIELALGYLDQPERRAVT